MIKSSGNVIDPSPYMDQYGIDTFRYFVIRDMVIGQDSTFSDDAFIRRVNSDLANDLGNGLNRVHKLVQTSFAGVLPSCQTWGEAEEELKATALRVTESVRNWVPQAKLSQIVEEIFVLVRGINRYLEVKAPWKLAKSEEASAKAELSTVLWVSAEAVRLSLSLLTPVMPGKCAEGLAMLGCSPATADSLRWGFLQGGETFGAGSALFPRIETEKAAPAAPPPKPVPVTAETVPGLLELRVAQIVAVADHPDAQSLFVLQVDAGEGALRTVCSGLKNSYVASDLQDRKVVLFANLKPAPLRGVMSQGMLLAGDGPEGKAVLVAPPAAAKPGARVSIAGVVASAEIRELKLKDFDKVTLSVQNGNVLCGNAALSVDGTPVTCAVADGAGVH